MEKRRVKKPRGLKWLLASYFLQTAVDCVILLLVWWMGMGFFIRFLVYPANAAQQAARASSQAILENGAFLPELVDPLCRYIVFGPGGEILQTDMSAGEQEQAQRNYRGDSMQNGFFYPKFYAHSRLENGQSVLLQYDFRQQYRNPALRGLPDFQTCYLLALALVGLFAVFLHTWLFARRLEKAIRKLAQAGGAIAAGELEQGDFSSTGVKELDGAMAAMDTLRKSLAASLKEQWELRRQRQAQVAALAHDLKTPLAVISGNAELLLEEPADGDDGRQELETILRSARRANDYLAQLVGTTAGAVEEKPRPVELLPLLEELGEMAGALCDQKGVRFCLTQRQEGRIVTGEAGLRRALANLLDNAARYAPQGGLVELAARLEQGGVTFEVRDNGPGFSPEALRRAGELLYTQDGARCGGHFGLGLAFAAEFARGQGGALKLENDPRGGARASLWLPPAQPGPAG